MNYKKIKKELLKNKVNDSELLTNVSVPIYEKNIFNYFKKINDLKEINKKFICLNHNDYNLLKLTYKGLKLITPKYFLDEFKNSKKQYFVLAFLIIELGTINHLNTVILDKKNKTIERFDIKKNSYKILDKILKVFLNVFELHDYNIITTDKFISDKIKVDNICVPISLLYIYLKMKYNLNLIQINTLLQLFNNKELFQVSDFILKKLT